MTDIGKRLLEAMRESDEWAMPADLVRSLEEQGLTLIGPEDAAVLEAMATVDREALECREGDSLYWACEAELARRAAKTGTMPKDET